MNAMPIYLCFRTHAPCHTSIYYWPMYQVISDDLCSHTCFLYVAGARLSTREIRQRRSGAITAHARKFLANYDASVPFSICLRDAEDLADRLMVDSFILLFNAERLRIFCVYFLKLYERFERKILRSPVPQARGLTLDSSQMLLLLEFHLQMDGKVWSIHGSSHSISFQWISSTWRRAAFEEHTLGQ